MMNDEDNTFRQYAQIQNQRALTDVLADLRRQVVDVGWPVPDHVRGRIPLITRFLNERHLARWFRAFLQAKALQALRDRKKVDWLALLELYPQYLVSIKGAGRKELVEIARWVQPSPQKGRGLLGWLGGSR